jgi:hypothetical protein
MALPTHSPLLTADKQTDLGVRSFAPSTSVRLVVTDARSAIVRNMTKNKPEVLHTECYVMTGRTQCKKPNIGNAPKEDMTKNRYPRGKLNPSDEGELVFKIANQDDTLLLIFNKPITWIGFNILETEQLISKLQEKLEQMKKTGH